MKRKNSFLYILGLLMVIATAQLAVAAPKAEREKVKVIDKKESGPLGLGADKFGTLPTLITSKSLEVESEKRIFYYRDAVVVKQGDLTLTCDELEGRYNENNQIEKIIAKKNVVMTKGVGQKATSQHAVYDVTTGIITMTANPKLEQNGSILQADVVKVFVNEDRSVAEGDVNVTMVNAGATPIPAAVVPIETVAPTAIPGVVVLGK